MKYTSLLNVLTLVSFFLMIVMNALANILPINGITTGAVSDSYPNLFAPAGATFSIWGVIYLLLGIYTTALFILKNESKQSFYNKLNVYFIISSVLNSIWILAWHYRVMWLTVILMFLLLLTLIKIADTIHSQKLSLREKLLVKIPFGVYFGWITVATIANITVFLISIGWSGWGLRDEVWTVLVLLVGVMISVWRTWKDNNLAYGLVPVWAYFGIWLKHTSATGFNGQYAAVINAVLFCLGLLFISNSLLVIRKRYI